MSEKYKSVAIRFFKAFASGAISFMGLVSIFVPKTYEEAKTLVATLAFAALFGGINGVLLAGEKLLSWKE